LQRRLGGRMALVSSVQMLNRTLVLYNVHLESRGSDELRYAQVSEIFSDVYQHYPDSSVLVAGDFNFDLSKEPAATLVSRTGFASVLHHGSLRPTTTPSRIRAPRSIDWVLSRGPVAASEVSLHDSICGSDHYPLSLTVGWT
jgi:endonuclease/exonuclease/phosphatase family metal-dependent hydrolase